MVTIANVQLASPSDRAVKRTLTMGRVHFFVVLVDKQAKREGGSRAGLLARAVLGYTGRNKLA